MTTHTHTTNKKPLFKRIKPLGWVLIALVAVSVVGLTAVLARPLTSSVRSLPTGTEAVATAPTITPYVQPTTMLVPTATPLPGGWIPGRGLTGQTVLIPPEDVAQDLQTAFNAAVACTHAAETPADQLLAQEGKEALCDKQQAYFAPTIKSAHVELGNAREINTFGVMNPPQCATPQLCTLAQAKLDVKGVILYNEENCKTVGATTAPCVSREPTQLEANQLFILTLALQEDGKWKVIEWQVEKLPGPPPSP